MYMTFALDISEKVISLNVSVSCLSHTCLYVYIYAVWQNTSIVKLVVGIQKSVISLDPHCLYSLVCTYVRTYMRYTVLAEIFT